MQLTFQTYVCICVFMIICLCLIAYTGFYVEPPHRGDPLPHYLLCTRIHLHTNIHIQTYALMKYLRNGSNSNHKNNLKLQALK